MPDFELPVRLEQVRQKSGAKSLRAFWEQLTANWRDAGGGPGISYEAVRNYHTVTRNPKHLREPSVEYLANVSRTFRVPLEWLATGKGPKQIRDKPELERDVAEHIAQEVRVGHSAAAKSVDRVTLDGKLALQLLVETAEREIPVALALLGGRANVNRVKLSLDDAARDTTDAAARKAMESASRMLFPIATGAKTTTGGGPFRIVSGALSELGKARDDLDTDAREQIRTAEDGAAKPKASPRTKGRKK